MERAICEYCNREFLKDDMIETEYGYVCTDCYKDRIQLEDTEIYD